MSLFGRFFLILLAFALAPLLAAGAWLLRSTNAARENARQVHQQLAAIYADVAESAAGDMNRALGFIQDLDRPGARPEGEEFKLLNRAAAANAAFALLSVLGEDGRETLRVADPAAFPGGEREDRSADPMVRAAAATRRAAIGPVFLSGKTPLVPLAHPLADGRCVYAVYSLERLWRRVRGQTVGREGRVLLLGGDGRPLAGLAEGLSGWDGPGGLAAESGWFESLETPAGPMVAAYAPSPSWGWRVMTLQPRSEAIVVSDRFAAQVLALLAALALAVAACAYWISGRITRPLRELVEASRRASLNEFSTPVPELGWGELNDLARTFNEMMCTLGTYQSLQVDRILQERAKIEALVHTIPDGVILSSFDGIILYMNMAARAILGGPVATTSPQGKSVHESVKEPALREMFVALMKRRRLSAFAQVELRGGTGSRGIYACRGVAVMRETRAVGVLVLMRDITTEVELERMKEQFFHSVVHDLRNPLGTITGFIELIEARFGSMSADDMRRFVRNVRSSLDQLSRLVQNILDAAKMESGTFELKLGPVDPAELAGHLRSIYQVQAESRGVAMAFESAPGLPPVRCDRELVVRVCMNLVGNALKFTPRGGRIRFGAAPAGPDGVELSVADSGPGIPADKLETVFEKFKQLETATASRTGYGLGLSICKSVAEYHGGRIWAESPPGEGARFVMRLPLEARPPRPR